MRRTNKLKCSDFNCTCGRTDCTAPKISGLLVRKINRVISAAGITNIGVKSGVRCDVANKQAGGAPNSSHKHGLGADLDIAYLNIEQRRRLWDEIDREKFSIIGLGPEFIHLDIRGHNSTLVRYIKTFIKFFKRGQ